MVSASTRTLCLQQVGHVESGRPPKASERRRLECGHVRRQGPEARARSERAQAKARAMRPPNTGSAGRSATRARRTERRRGHGRARARASGRTRRASTSPTNHACAHTPVTGGSTPSEREGREPHDRRVDRRVVLGHGAAQDVAHEQHRRRRGRPHARIGGGRLLGRTRAQLGGAHVADSARLDADRCGVEAQRAERLRQQPHSTRFARAAT